MSYTRFIILGQQRTGSILLQRLLDSHPHIMCGGEVFNPSLPVRQSIIRLERPIEDGADPIAYLNDVVFKTYPPELKAVGFRLFYDHARDKNWGKVWDYLRQTPVRVIHLRRRNLLDRYLSLQLAQRTNVWVTVKKTTDAYNAPIKLDPAACFNDFSRYHWQEKESEALFTGCPLLNVTYEDLTHQKEKTIRGILDFLGVSWHELTTGVKKQRVRSKQEIIENYEELKSYLIAHMDEAWAQAEWLTFFDDE